MRRAHDLYFRRGVRFRQQVGADHSSSYTARALSSAKTNPTTASPIATAKTNRFLTLIDGHMRNAYAKVVKRKFHVTLIEHEEGVSVSCPELPGCHSQGANVEEALQNIQDAIREYLEVYGEPETRCEIREMEVVTA
jgi:predicted RNase H-like HicB family nuclease